MNYETKIYKEKLKLARELIEKEPSLKDCIIDKFPELKESEDERTYREIREYFDEYISDSDPRKKHWLTYLEKQKEQKPTVTHGETYHVDTLGTQQVIAGKMPQKPADDKTFEEWIDDWWKHNKVNNPDSYDKGDEIQFDERGFKNFCRGIKNMYAEQKPAEWDEFDKDCLKRAIWYVENPAPSVVKDTNLVLWLKSIPERFNLQPKQEWSEKDKEIMDSLIKYHYDQGEISPKHNKWASWLKSLPERFNPQPKAKWSDDYDEENIQTRFAFYTYKDDSSTLYLSNVFVEEASRNHGFGTRILKAAEKVAETVGATIISLKVKQDSPANAWYRKRGYGYVAFEDGYDWLEKNLEYLKPTKLAEWNEDDKTRLKVIKEELERYIMFKQYGTPLSVDDIDWLQSLPERFSLQPKQEWSEEDEEILGKLHRLIVICREELRFIKESEYDKLEEFLKSLRPSWKPSEEQMEAFEKCLDYLEESENEDYEVLQSLYEDLKKLM